MTIDEEIEEVRAWCVSIVVFYHNSGDTWTIEELFEDAIRSVALWVEESGLDEMEADRRLFEPLHSELVARFDDEIGSSLCAGFLAACRDARRSNRPDRPIPPQPPTYFDLHFKRAGP